MWDLTLREVISEIALAAAQQREAVELATYGAYMVSVVRFTAQKKKRMPKLETFLPRPPHEPRQSPAQMRAVLHGLAGQYGWKVRRVPRSHDAPAAP